MRFIIDERLSFVRADTDKPFNKGSMWLICNPFTLIGIILTTHPQPACDAADRLPG